MVQRQITRHDTAKQIGIIAVEFRMMPYCRTIGLFTLHLHNSAHLGLALLKQTKIKWVHPILKYFIAKSFSGIKRNNFKLCENEARVQFSASAFCYTYLLDATNPTPNPIKTLPVILFRMPFPRSDESFSLAKEAKIAYAV